MTAITPAIQAVRGMAGPTGSSRGVCSKEATALASLASSGEFALAAGAEVALPADKLL